MSCGIIVGSDRKQQDLLPFFWLNLRLHNNIPVTFFDFGMDENYLCWCRERGEVISLRDDDTAKSALSWFKKPLALTLSPYEKTLWIDTDCFIRGNIAKLFDYCDNDAGLGMVKEPDSIINKWRQAGFISANSIMYNSGVIAVKKGCPTLEKWKDACIHNISYRGDQEILADILLLTNVKPALIPDEYNWLINGHQKVNKDSHVLHMTGHTLKNFLKIARSRSLVDIKQTFKL